MRILVVSDEDARGHTMAECIERGDASAEVLRCAVTDMVGCIDRERPSVVLLAGDGDVVRAVRGHAPTLPVVAMVLSDTDDASAGAHALDSGATDVITVSELEPRIVAWRLHLAVRHHDGERRLREAKELAETASARKTEFLSSMSHEIRTPLNTVVGMADLLEETQLDERQRRYVSTLQRASDHVLALIENVLDVARIEAGTVTIEESGFDLYELIESAVDIVRVQAKRKRLELGWTVGPDVPRELRGDPRRIRQVLVNLLGNAVKFTGQGRVWLKIVREGEDGTKAKLRVMVTDTGVGIPESKLEAIFSGFVQVGEDDRKRGYGLGLSISRRIVERMGGRLWVESVLGKGSTFHVALALPIARGVVSPTFEAHEPKTSNQAKLRASGDRAVRVLVVDDSEDNRVLLGEYLRGADADVEFADDGPTALEKATSQPFDVVLMDLQLPQLDGYETTRELLRRVRDRGMKAPAVIALSAHVLTESFTKSIEAGCTTQLTKPIRKRTLLEAIARAAGARTVEAAEPAKGPMRDEILPLLPRFFANRRADVRIIRDAADRNDMAAISTLAHNMRGTGASYGFPEITALGERLSAAGKRAATSDLQNLATELDQMLDDLEAQYSEVAAAAASAQQKKKQAGSVRVQSTEPLGHDKH